MWLAKAFLALILAASPIGAVSVDSVALTVSSLQRSVDFYTQVLDFRQVAASPGQVRLQLGSENLVLLESPAGRLAPADIQGNDQWFQHVAIIVSDMDQAFARLRAHHVSVISRGGPQRLPDWNKNAGGIRACYFKDPDGHPLEILWFPKDKGEARWHETAKLFLGIDHTAITIRSTEKSLAFYQGLGFRLRGSGENYGPEQERLNNVRGAHLRITSVRGDAGPAVEFLEYLKPGPGRDYPTDGTPQDLVHWQIQLAGAASLEQDHLVRDPDHHALVEVLP